MTQLVFGLLVFLAVGTVFLFFHMLMGAVIRPHRPGEEKLTIYECGEPTVGSAWIQFDLRYYVVALLFVVFDVEVAFFFPWAVVFGGFNELARQPVEADRQKIVMERKLIPNQPPLPKAQESTETISQESAQSWAWIAFADMLVFFGVLMVGFAYLWKRGDLDWVRSTDAHVVTAPAVAMPRAPVEPILATQEQTAGIA